MKTKTSLTQDEIKENIRKSRNTGRLSDAIEICKIAEKRYPYNYFYSKICGDLYFENNDYKFASDSYLEFLKRIPPGHKVFGDFAIRYYKLKKVFSQSEIQQYAHEINNLIRIGAIYNQNVERCRELLRDDIQRIIDDDTSLSLEASEIIPTLRDGIKFTKSVNKIKKLEVNRPDELEYLLDKYVLDRKRSIKYLPIDKYSITSYEKLGQFDKALKIAREITDIIKKPMDPVVVRTVFRLCRKIGNYEQADKLLEQQPDILKSDNFNVLYELVYYFENKNNIDQVQMKLSHIERQYVNSIPIQQTLKYFYLRFGMVDDANRIEQNIKKLNELRRKGSSKYYEQVDESEAELGSKIKELYSTIEHQKQLAAISDLTTGISHELGQPITNIRYTIQFYRKLLDRKLEKETVLNVFNSVLEETERMGGLIKRLSQSTSSKSVIEQFDIMERIRKRVKAEKSRLIKEKIQVTISPKATINHFSDPVKFDQIISNLLLNSIDAIVSKQNSKGNRISIKVEDLTDSIRITFADTGIGIPIKSRAKIFDPFYSTKAPGKGEGLGLFIVWNLIKMTGGRIALDYNYNNGACFVIYLQKTKIEKEN